LDEASRSVGQSEAQTLASAASENRLYAAVLSEQSKMSAQTITTNRKEESMRADDAAQNEGAGISLMPVCFKQARL
jgi:hypothetical protein